MGNKQLHFRSSFMHIAFPKQLHSLESNLQSSRITSPVVQIGDSSTISDILGRKLQSGIKSGFGLVLSRSQFMKPSKIL